MVLPTFVTILALEKSFQAVVVETIAQGRLGRAYDADSSLDFPPKVLQPVSINRPTLPLIRIMPNSKLIRTLDIGNICTSTVTVSGCMMVSN